MNAQTKETQAEMTPQLAHQVLAEGNQRFVAGDSINRDLRMQVNQTSTGQFPFAVVLSCIDSRVPVETVFDQGIGDIFSARVAGNIVNEDVLGSIEYGCKVAGSKLILVLGHTKCGAVTAACNGVELGNITPLLSKIKPAVDAIKTGDEKMTSEQIEDVSIENVKRSMDRLRAESPILAEMEQNGEIIIEGAVYSVADGKVTFL